MKTFLLPFLLAAAGAASECSEPSPPPAAAVATSSPTEDLGLYRTSELLTSVTLCDQQVKAALLRGDNASAQYWAVRRGYILDELRKRGVNAPPEATPTPRPVYRRRSGTPGTSGLPGG